MASAQMRGGRVDNNKAAAAAARREDRDASMLIPHHYGTIGCYKIYYRHCCFFTHAINNCWPIFLSVVNSAELVIPPNTGGPIGPCGTNLVLGPKKDSTTMSLRGVLQKSVFGIVFS